MKKGDESLTPLSVYICSKVTSSVRKSSDSLRSRRLEVAGERENGRARGRHASAHYFQAPATQARVVIHGIKMM